MAPMSTETILSATPNLEADALAHAIRELNGGRVLVVPTDTVYGIGCDASNPDAVNAVLAAKGRGRQMPPPVLVASVDAIDSLCVDVPDYARTLARAFWPGGLTLILRARPDLGWDLGETDGTIGVRMPNQDALLTLLRDFGPMAVTSANLTGHPPATSVQQAIGYFGTSVAAYLDGGPTRGTTASSIVDCAHGDPRVIRQGTISLADLSAVADMPIRETEGRHS